MDAQHVAIAETCLHGAHDGGMSFPVIVQTLITKGFEGYFVDYRRDTTTYYLADGDSVTLENLASGGAIAPGFDADGVAAQIRWAQANPPEYSYDAFCRNVRAAGCAGYLVSFPGRRVVYLGRTGDTHVELMP